MITVNEGMVEIEANDVPTICADVTVILREARQKITEMRDKEIADRMLDKAWELSKATDEEIAEEIMKVKAMLLMEILFGGGVNPDGSVDK